MVEKLPYVGENCSIANWQQYPTGHPFNCEEALRSLLENEIRDIESLKELVILPGGWRPLRVDLNLVLLSPTVERLKARTQKRAYDIVEEMRLKLEAEEAGKDEARVACNFCVERHLWVHCHNLCNFCGEYGNFSQHLPNSASLSNI